MPKSPSQPGKVRLQFDFSQDAVDRIDMVRKRLDAGSRAEVVRRALRLLDYAMRRQEDGDEIIFRDASGNERALDIL